VNYSRVGSLAKDPAMELDQLIEDPAHTEMERITRKPLTKTERFKRDEKC